VKQTGRFLDYAVSQKIKSCKEITLTLINEHIKTLTGYTYKTIEQVLCALRSFFKKQHTTSCYFGYSRTFGF
jgi:hypothetical protein